MTAEPALRVHVHCLLGELKSAPGHGCNDGGAAWIAVIPASTRPPDGSCALHLFMNELRRRSGTCNTGIKRKIRITRDAVVTDLDHADLAASNGRFLHIDVQHKDVVDDFTCTD